jgi:hypothetical protein
MVAVDTSSLLTENRDRQEAGRHECRRYRYRRDSSLVLVRLLTEANPGEKERARGVRDGSDHEAAGLRVPNLLERVLPNEFSRLEVRSARELLRCTFDIIGR